MGVVTSRPDLVRSLILMDTSAETFVPDDSGVRAMLRGYIDNFDPARGMPADWGMPGPEDDLIARATTQAWRDARQQQQLGMDAYAAKALGGLLLDGVPFGSQLGSITCPVTVLVGERDHPLVDQAPDLAAAVTDGRLVVIPGAYHSPQLTHPSQWREAVEAHLAWVNG